MNSKIPATARLIHASGPATAMVPPPWLEICVPQESQNRAPTRIGVVQTGQGIVGTAGAFSAGAGGVWLSAGTGGVLDIRGNFDRSIFRSRLTRSLEPTECPSWPK